jgi:cyclopropane-fatty-acyl-phospholipid synthase
MRKGSQGRLVTESIENIGPRAPPRSRLALLRVDERLTDYARTLRAWRTSFEARFESEIVPALKEAYPEIKSRQDIEVFRRKWCV